MPILRVFVHNCETEVNLEREAQILPKLELFEASKHTLSKYFSRAILNFPEHTASLYRYLSHADL